MAVVAVTGKPAAGVNYTVTTASSADWASVSNSTYFYDLTDKLVHYKDSTGTVLEIYGAAGGLTYFTEAQNTTAPNATVPVDSLTAVTATTNGDIAIVPKGAGAFTLAVPNNLVSGGNKRGLGAVDLQMIRSVNTQVASGVNTFIVGRLNTALADDSYCIGALNTTNGFYSTAIGLQNSTSGSYALAFGYLNISSGQNGFAGGYGNTASGSFSVALGNGNTASNTGSVSLGQVNNVSGISSFAAGSNNTNAGPYSAIFGFSNTISGAGYTFKSGYGNTGAASYSITTGYNNAVSGESNGCFGSSSTVSADNAFNLGYGNTNDAYAGFTTGWKCHTFGITGRKVFASGGYVVGDSQKSIFNLRIRTTNATPTVLTSNAGVSGTTNQLILQDNNSIRFKGTIIGRQSGSTNTSAWDIDGVIQRGVGVATTTLLISNVNLVINLNVWGTPTLTADVTNGALNVSVIGIASTNIQWSCTLETTEVIYA